MKLIGLTLLVMAIVVPFLAATAWLISEPPDVRKKQLQALLKGLKP